MMHILLFVVNLWVLKIREIGFQSQHKTKMIGNSHKYQDLSLLSQLNQQIKK